MSQSLTPFIGTRTRFMRYGDARIFHGWIQEVMGDKLTVNCPNDPPIMMGDRFGFEAFGERSAAAFDAVFTTRGELETIVGATDGSSARVIDMAAASLHFRIVSNIRVQASNEPMRLRVEELYAEVEVGDQRLHVLLPDVSPGGVALDLPFETKPGDGLTLWIPAPVEILEMTGTIVYCRAQENPGTWRCGVKFGALDRISMRRWTAFLGQYH